MAARPARCLPTFAREKVGKRPMQRQRDRLVHHLYRRQTPNQHRKRCGRRIQPHLLCQLVGAQEPALAHGWPAKKWHLVVLRQQRRQCVLHRKRQTQRVAFLPRDPTLVHLARWNSSAHQLGLRDCHGPLEHHGHHLHARRSRVQVPELRERDRPLRSMVPVRPGVELEPVVPRAPLP